jgi:amidohydrolase
MPIVEVHTAIDNFIASQNAELRQLSLAIHANPEVGWEEQFASKCLGAYLEQQGFAVQYGYCDLPTAFRATYELGSGGPTVTYLAEYDALPEIGHACGHNLIGVAAVAAGAGLKAAMLAHSSGRIQVIGTPAEENGGGKIILLERGGFVGTDVAMMVHGGARNMVVRSSVALIDLTFRFYGKAAHASSSPHLGINALDACIQTFNSINAMRQHFPDETRVHGIISHGGSAPNVVPDYAEAKFMVRHPDIAVVRMLRDRARGAAEHAAASVGARVEIDEGPEYGPRKNNRTLAERFGTYLQALGETLHDPPQRGGVGSSDFNNVSQVFPAIHPYIKIAPEGTATHTREFRDAAGSEAGLRGMLNGATCLAKTGADVLTDPAFLQAARVEFHS